MMIIIFKPSPPVFFDLVMLTLGFSLKYVVERKILFFYDLVLIRLFSSLKYIVERKILFFNDLVLIRLVFSFL